MALEYFVERRKNDSQFVRIYASSRNPIHSHATATTRGREGRESVTFVSLCILEALIGLGGNFWLRIAHFLT